MSGWCSKLSNRAVARHRLPAFGWMCGLSKVVMKISYLALVVIALALLLAGCDASTLNAPAPGSPNQPASGQPAAPPQWGQRTKTSGCAVNGPLPDSACTPGDIFPQATRNDICTPGY